MSSVTNIILFTRCGEDEDEVKKWLTKVFDDQGQSSPPVAIDSQEVSDLLGKRAWYGGSKCLEAEVYVGAFNYMDVGALVASMPTYDWRYPEAVQLLVNEQDDDAFQLAYGEVRMSSYHPKCADVVDVESRLKPLLQNQLTKGQPNE